MNKPYCSINIYKSPEAAFWVNSFIIETENGVVVIDTQFLVSTAQELKQKVEATGKPILAIIITHPHPDHFNGTIVLSPDKDGFPVYATQATFDGIKATEAEKREFWKQKYADDYPDATVFPNRLLQPKDELTIDGVHFVIDELGAGESLTNTVIYLPNEKILLASDLVYERAHPWLAEGRSTAWLKHLEYLKIEYGAAKTVYAGHGGKTSLVAVDEQAEYIRDFTRIVQDETNGSSKLSDDQKAHIKTIMQERYAGYALEFLIDLNTDGLMNKFIGENEKQV